MDRAKTHLRIRHVGHPQRKETEKEYEKKEEGHDRYGGRQVELAPDIVSLLKT